MAIRWHHAEIGNATNVLANAPLCWMVQKQAVDESHQRRTLPANGLLGHAKVGHGGDPRNGADDRSLAKAKC